MKIKLLGISFCVLLLFLNGLPKRIQKKVDKEIKSAYALTSFEMTPILFSDTIQNELSAPFGELNLFSIISEEKHIGYAYIGSALGKTDIFDFLILFDPNLIIVKTKVLIYREDYGGEIGSKRWLKQFIGKNHNEKLKLGEDIIAISGATLSVRSMTNAVNKVLASLHFIHQNKLLQ